MTDPVPSRAELPANDNMAFCPHCGCNLVAEQPVVIGPLSYDPRGDLCWRDRPLPLSPHQLLILGALVQARGAIVTNDVLAERSGYDGTGDSADVVKVLICRIRHHLRSAGAPPTMIVTVRGRGCRLDTALLQGFDSRLCKGASPC